MGVQITPAAGVKKTGDTMTGDLIVPDEAYDATNWNGSLEVPTKNAVRDKIETVTSGSGVLAQESWRPASDTTIVSTSTTLHDLDDDITGDPIAVLTFTAPSSGAVDLELQSQAGCSGNYYMVWGLRDSGGDVANTIGRITFATVFHRVSYFIHLEGLTPGNSYTYKWAWKAESAGTVNLYVGPTFGPLVMRAVAGKA